VAAAAPVPRYAWLQAAPGVDVSHEQPGFLERLNAVGAALKRKIVIFSGYRTDAYSVAHGGFAGDPHTRGIAADVTVGGVPIGRVRGAQAAIAAQGLRSGNQAGFYKGQPDPAHVDAAGGGIVARAGSSSYQQLQELWIAAGGPPSAAAVMAAVAMAESRGNPRAHNSNAGTGDDSYGLWQINYYGNLRASRTARFGPPSGMYDPQKNAVAAVAIYSSSGPSAWSTFKSGAYAQYLNSGGPGGSAPAAGGSIRTRPPAGGGGGSDFWGDVAGGVEGAAESGWKAVVGAVEGPLAIVKAALWLLNPQSWLRAVEFVVGIGLMLLGLLGLATVFAARNPAVRKAASVAALAPGPVGAIGKGVTVAGAGSGRRATSRAPNDRELASARVETERERRRAVRARSRRALEQSRETRAERERRERRAYYRGAADAGKP
jgi:hypothetical protein